MVNRNYVVSPKNPWIRGYTASNDQFCGSNGQCTERQCLEWINNQPCYPELVKDGTYGFSVCPRCGVSYGKEAMTGEEYRLAVSSA